MSESLRPPSTATDGSSSFQRPGPPRQLRSWRGGKLVPVVSDYTVKDTDFTVASHEEFQSVAPSAHQEAAAAEQSGDHNRN